MRDADLVIHSALAVQPVRDEDYSTGANGLVPQAVLNAMASVCIRQLVYASSLGIYAARGPGRTRNRRPYARRRGTDSGASRRALTRCDPPVTVVLWPQRLTPHEYRRYRQPSPVTRAYWPPDRAGRALRCRTR